MESRDIRAVHSCVWKVSPSSWRQSSETIQSLTSSEVGAVSDQATCRWFLQSLYKHLIVLHTVLDRILAEREDEDEDEEESGGGEDREKDLVERLDDEEEEATVVGGEWLGGGGRRSGTNNYGGGRRMT